MVTRKPGLIALLMGMLLLAGVANGQVRVWNGSTPNWATPGNWNPNGDPAINRLRWTGSGQALSNNDAPVGTTFRSMEFSGLIPYTIGGSSIILVDNIPGAQGSIMDSSTVMQTINAQVEFNDDNKYGFIGKTRRDTLALNKIALGNSLSFLRISTDSVLGPVLVRDSIKGDKPIIIGVNQQGLYRPNTSVVFRGDNTNFTGPISVQAGTLILRNNHALGESLSNSVEILQGGTLELRDAITISGKTITVGGSGVGDTGIIRAGNGAGICNIQSDVIASNSIRVRALLNSVLNFTNIGRSSSLPWTVIFQGPGEININGTFGKINGGGAFGSIIRSGETGSPSILRFYDSANFNGLLTISSATLELAGKNKLPASTPLILVNSTLKTAGYNQSFGSLRIQEQGNVNSTIALNNSNDTLIFGPSREFAWTVKKLNITGWVGTIAGNPGTKGRIFVRDTLGQPGFTEQQLSQVSFPSPFCSGAMLLLPVTLPDGSAGRELVPSTLPYIASFGQSSRYVGDLIIVTGCGLSSIGSYTFKVGDSVVSAVTPISAESFSFVLKDNHSGLLSITSLAGTRTLPSPELVNLGYITQNSGLTGWNVPLTWLGGNVPPADRSITLTRPVRCTTSVNNPNTGSPRNKSITINGSGGALKIGPLGAIGGPTSIRLNGGALRTFDDATNQNTPSLPPPTGNSIVFDTLTVLANSSIALGSGVHTLRFTNSSNAQWTAGRLLTIHNWYGIKADTINGGTQGKIFVGNNALGLTETQLRNIQFNGFCQGAMLASNGELLPSDNPFINSVNAGKGGSLQAYHGDTIKIIGCQFDDVKRVDIGSVNVQDTLFIQGDALNPLVSDTMRIIGNNSFPQDTIYLYNSVDATGGGKSNGVLRKLGFLMTKDGNWSDAGSWLGTTIPPVNARTTIGTDLALVSDDILMDAAPDSVFIETGKMLQVANGRTLTINKALVINSTASFLPQPNSVLNLGGGGRIVNNGYFNSDVSGTVFLNGTVNLDSSATITGTKRIHFNNLILNKGLLKLPTKLGNNAPFIPDSIPQVNSTFTLKGGALQYEPGYQKSQVGPIYGEGSSLVYSTGGVYTRGIEWNSSTLSAQHSVWPGLPFNVVIEENTSLVVNPTPNTIPDVPDPQNLLMRGSLFLRGNSRLNYNYYSPLEVNGSIEIGTDPLSLDSLIITHSLAGLILKGGLTVYEKSGLRLHTNNFIEIAGNQDGDFRTPGANNFAISRLRLNKSLGGDFRLFSPLSIADSMLFVKGIISTMADSIYLEIKASASVIGGSIVSFVNGQMRKITAISPANASSDFEFRIGKKSTDGTGYFYRPVRVANMTHNGTTTYSAEFFNTPTQSPPFMPGFIDPILYGVWADQWWEVKRQSGTGQARVGIKYTPGSTWDPDPPCCNVAVVRYETGSKSWKFTKGHPFNGPTHNYPEAIQLNNTDTIYSAVLNGFSPFTVGFGFDVILPIQLLSFTATPQLQDVLLQWRIDDAKELDYFGVEYSMDGINFKNIATIRWQANKEFSYLHSSPGNGTHYYRLLMVDKDGVEKYSRIELVQFGTYKTIIAGVINNPVQGTSAQLKVYSAANQMGEAAVYDMSGRLVLRQKVSLQAGQNQVPISFTVLAHGQYYLNFQTQDGVRATLPVMW